MINKTYHQLLDEKKSDLLTLYFTAGYPKIESTKVVLNALNTSDVDLIEIGMPYSDPLADGPVIQQTASKALENGMNLNYLFEQIAQVELDKPVFLMGYFNQFLQYGPEKFLKKCSEMGVSGLILPDLPLGIYKKDYEVLFEKYKQKIVFLATPHTPEARLQDLVKATTGFLYLVTSNATTGGVAKMDEALENQISKIRKMDPDCIVQLGFGIRDKAGLLNAHNLADGGIIGTAFLSAMQSDDLQKSVNQFLESLK